MNQALQSVEWMNVIEGVSHGGIRSLPIHLLILAINPVDTHWPPIRLQILKKYLQECH